MIPDNYSGSGYEEINYALIHGIESMRKVRSNSPNGKSEIYRPRYCWSGYTHCQRSHSAGTAGSLYRADAYRVRTVCGNQARRATRCCQRIVFDNPEDRDALRLKEIRENKGNWLHSGNDFWNWSAGEIAVLIIKAIACWAEAKAGSKKEHPHEKAVVIGAGQTGRGYVTRFLFQRLCDHFIDKMNWSVCWMRIVHSVSIL